MNNIYWFIVRVTCYDDDSLLPSADQRSAKKVVMITPSIMPGGSRKKVDMLLRRVPGKSDLIPSVSISGSEKYGDMSCRREGSLYLKLFLPVKISIYGFW